MKRSTAIVLIVFLALVGLLLYLKQQEPGVDELAAEVTPPAPVEFLLPESDGRPVSIDIKSGIGEQVVIARNEAGAWVLEQPIETEAPQGGEADQAFAEAAATQLSSLRIESRLEVALEAAGLIQPSYILIIELSSGTVKNVRIGDLTPTGIGYYARIDSSDETLILNRTGLEALLTLLETPPFMEPTPTNMP
jgi:hypothetical protein